MTAVLMSGTFTLIVAAVAFTAGWACRAYRESVARDGQVQR